MDNRELRQLVDHMQWADSLVWGSLIGHHETRSDQQIRACVHHTHQVQWVYLQLWRNEQPSIVDAAAFRDLFEIYDWCRRYYGELPDYLASLDSAALKRQIDFPWAAELVKKRGRAQSVTLAESILQLTSHTTYHRGQANRRLRELGAEPQLTDFVAWIWMGRPAAEWRTGSAA